MSEGIAGEIALHPGWAPDVDLEEAILIARRAGFDGVELSLPKLVERLDADGGGGRLAAVLDDMSVTMIDALLGIERPDRRRANLDLCRRVAERAEGLGTPALQVVALDGFDDRRADAMLGRVVDALGELAEITAPCGIRLALEPVSFSPFHDLGLAIEAVDRVGRERAGLVLDTWHLWTAGVAWPEVAAIDRSLIVCAHIGDSGPRRGPAWSDEDRSALPGDGVVPLAEAIEAVAATGFDGPWSVELLGAPAGWEPAALAVELQRRSRRLLGRDC